MATFYFGNFGDRKLRWTVTLFTCAFVFVAVVVDQNRLIGQAHQQVDSDLKEIVFKFGDREFSRIELDQVRTRHFATMKFLENLEKIASQMKGDDFRSYLPRGLKISPANSSTDNPDALDSIVMERVLFAEAAQRQGVTIDDGVVNSYLDRLAGNKNFSEADLQSINRPINGEQVGLDEIRDHMKIELAAKIYRIMLYSGIQSTPNPTEAASIYKKLNQRIQCNVLPLAVSNYLSKVTDKPRNEKLKEIFEEGKYQYSDRLFQKPGFKLAPRFKIQYLYLDPNLLFENKIKNVTDAEVQKTYDGLALDEHPLVMEAVPNEAVPNDEAVPLNNDDNEKEHLEISPGLLQLNIEGDYIAPGLMRVKELDDSLSLAIRESIAREAAFNTTRELIEDALNAIQRGEDAQGLALKLNMHFGETNLLTIVELLDDEHFGSKIGNVEKTSYGQRYSIPFGVAIADRVDKLAIGETDRLQESMTRVEYIWWLTEKEEPRVRTFAEAEEDVRAYWQFQKAREFAVADAKKIAAFVSSRDIPLQESKLGKEGQCAETGQFTWMSYSGYSIAGLRPEGVESPGEDFMSTAFGLALNEMGVALNAPENIVYVIQKIADVRQPASEFYAELNAEWKRFRNFPEPITQVMDRQVRDVASEYWRLLADHNVGNLEQGEIKTNPAQWEELSYSLESTLMNGTTSDLTDLAEQFPKAIASHWGLMIAGDITLREGLSTPFEIRENAIRKLDKAKRLYQRVVESKFTKTPMLQRRAIFGLAYSLESLGEFEKAEKYYSQLIEEDSELTDTAKRGLARTQDEELRAFFEVFTKTSAFEAPGLPLPRPSKH